ncbi:MAG: hypothetical protein ABSA12_03875 [Verrucomicrobiia bacterium]
MKSIFKPGEKTALLVVLIVVILFAIFGRFIMRYMGVAYVKPIWGTTEQGDSTLRRPFSSSRPRSSFGIKTEFILLHFAFHLVY